MHILLLGRETSITSTIVDMINYMEEWSVNIISAHQKVDKDLSCDIIVINLVDFSISSPDLIRNTKTTLPSPPVLALHTYKNKTLINPLLEAGAIGYLQLGTSEECVQQAIKMVAADKKCISLM